MAIAWDITWVDETGSTNADLLALARSGAPEGTVLAADHQTAGRGRLDRTWTAPPGSSLLVSVLLRRPPSFWLTAAIGVAACRAVHRLGGLDVALKWPNDLVVRTSGRKLAGILAEADPAAGPGGAVVVGMGMNVRWPPRLELPGELSDRVVALNDLDIAVERPALLDAILAELGGCLDSPTLAAENARLSATVGASVRVERADDVVEGQAVAITPAGALQVATRGGGVVEITSGDVIHLR